MESNEGRRELTLIISTSLVSVFQSDVYLDNNERDEQSITNAISQRSECVVKYNRVTK